MCTVDTFCICIFIHLHLLAIQLKEILYFKQIFASLHKLQFSNLRWRYARRRGAKPSHWNNTSLVRNKDRIERTRYGHYIKLINLLKCVMFSWWNENKVELLSLSTYHRDINLLIMFLVIVVHWLTQIIWVLILVKIVYVLRYAKFLSH